MDLKFKGIRELTGVSEYSLRRAQNAMKTILPRLREEAQRVLTCLRLRLN